jgi:Domain of unknown function (DUF4145)
VQCPHCSISFHDNWCKRALYYNDQTMPWEYQIGLCPACYKQIIEIRNVNTAVPPEGGYEPFQWVQVYPVGANRGPVPVEVPAHIALDYIEGCRVLPFSAKASAALSRRCLQTILHEHGYKARDLAKEIDLLLNEADPRKAIPESLRVTVDTIRNFGNFSAHPVTDLTTLQIIDVEPEEADWCLETIEEMFRHFYVRPQQAKERKALLDAKLAAAGKPPSKQ